MFYNNGSSTDKSIEILFEYFQKSIYEYDLANTFPADESTEPLLEARCRSIL